MDKADISSERERRGQIGFKKRAQSIRPLLLQKGQAPKPAGLGGQTAGSLLLPPSPSSAGLSLSQTKDALLKILDDMKELDYLNFILFSADVTTWKDDLVQATPENIQEARIFVKNIHDQGSKNGGKSRRSLPLPLA